MSFLGIDFGTKNIGVAISDDNNQIAFPLKTVQNKDFFKFLDSLLKERKIEKIVVGLPLSLKMQKTQQTDLTLNFFKRLKRKFKGEIVLENEFYTSRQADKLLGDYKKGMIDAVSAALILQSYLDKIKKIHLE